MRYSLLRSRVPESDQPRVVRNLVALRDQLHRDIPAKDAEDNLLLATWNVRDLGKINRRGFGDRLPETYFYIAEVLSRFDFVAVQEVNELDEWQRITEILGFDFGWIATDVTDPGLGGNGERLTYLYDKRRVLFQNVAGEIVLPAKLLITANVTPREESESGTETVTIEDKQLGKQFRRTPFTALFQAAWFKFEICTVHIYYGSESGAELQQRIQEIDRVANYFGARAENAFDDRRSLILLGDFNIVGAEHETMKALLGSGFEVPQPLRRPTNIDHSKFYDQIAFRTRPGDLAYLESDGAGRAGAFEIFERVFTPEQFADYEGAAETSSNGARAAAEGELDDYYLEWRTYQFSDHLPLWVRLQVNDSADYLEGLVDE